ncbi:MAG: hypothetical protein A2091_06335 [Desulfuromonadales bacterium GWD2_61_12]|nr:MAG: hypothetical protein A2005_02755 [Desulfuromonadales bacterium GWC2_61_20]OGR32286.1 MAG: hypothetical protein A2091_06335 [Desulfuromonadales bacterium GWD2_61_12]
MWPILPRHAGDHALRWPAPTILCLALLSVVLLAGCGKKEPLRLGYTGPLSGKGVGLGIGGRDGALLAVEEVNRTGGIGGRRVELLVEDDGQKRDQAVTAARLLMDREVVAIIGNMTSAMSVATAPLATERQTLMFSPTSSTEELTRQDDYFFRLHAPIGDYARRLADFLYHERGVRAVAVIIDRGNDAYTGSFLASFQTQFTAAGGTVTTTVDFVSAAAPQFHDLTRKALRSRPQGLLLLANAPDSAMFAQQVGKNGSPTLLLGSEWSATPELLTLGGKAVDGMIFMHGIDESDPGPTWRAFGRAFYGRFGYRPGFAAAYAYETTRILLQALATDGEPRRLRATITAIGTFAGLQGAIRIDRFGDPERGAFPLVVVNGQMQRLRK